jgi:hypothetical protein
MTDWPHAPSARVEFLPPMSPRAGRWFRRMFRDELGVEHWLDSLREADAFSFDVEGD